MRLYSRHMECVIKVKDLVSRPCHSARPQGPLKVACRVYDSYIPCFPHVIRSRSRAWVRRTTTTLAPGGRRGSGHGSWGQRGGGRPTR